MSNDPNRRKPNKPQPGGDDENRKARRIVVLIVAALIATLLINSLYTTISNAYLTEITYTEFKELLSSGQISEVEFQSDDRIVILTKDQAEKSEEPAAALLHRPHSQSGHDLADEPARHSRRQI